MLEETSFLPPSIHTSYTEFTQILPKASYLPPPKNEILLRIKAHIPECLYKYLQVNFSFKIHNNSPL